MLLARALTVSFGKTGSRISVPSVCEGSRLARLGDGRGFAAKIPNFDIAY
jgi:hypothetical protein